MRYVDLRIRWKLLIMVLSIIGFSVSIVVFFIFNMRAIDAQQNLCYDVAQGINHFERAQGQFADFELIYHHDEAYHEAQSSLDSALVRWREMSSQRGEWEQAQQLIGHLHSLFAQYRDNKQREVQALQAMTELSERIVPQLLNGSPDPSANIHHYDEIRLAIRLYYFSYDPATLERAQRLFAEGRRRFPSSLSGLLDRYAEQFDSMIAATQNYHRLHDEIAENLKTTLTSAYRAMGETRQELERRTQLVHFSMLLGVLLLILCGALFVYMLAFDGCAHRAGRGADAPHRGGPFRLRS